MKQTDKLEQLYYENRGRMYAEAFRILRNQTDAEDAVHNVFLVLCKNPAICDKVLSLVSEKQTAYLVVASRNHALNILSRKTRTESFSDDPLLSSALGTDALNPENTIVENVTVNNALTALPERNRTAVMLYYDLGLSSVEIGKLLGIKASSARKLINRTIKYLKQLLDS